MRYSEYRIHQFMWLTVLVSTDPVHACLSFIIIPSRKSNFEVTETTVVPKRYQNTDHQLPETKISGRFEIRIKHIQMGCDGSCGICLSALLTYVLQTRIGFCKLCILVFGLVASILVAVTFTNGLGYFYFGVGQYAFVLFATEWS